MTRAAVHVFGWMNEGDPSSPLAQTRRRSWIADHGRKPGAQRAQDARSGAEAPWCAAPLYVRRHGANEATDTSDVDLFFDCQKVALGLDQLTDVQERTTEILGRTADITTRDSLHAMLRAKIEAMAVQVF